jgi:hypothetical protein
MKQQQNSTIGWRGCELESDLERSWKNNNSYGSQHLERSEASNVFRKLRHVRGDAVWLRAVVVITRCNSHTNLTSSPHKQNTQLQDIVFVF